MLPVVRSALLAAAAVAFVPAWADAPIRDTHYGTNGVARVAFDIGGDKQDVPKAPALLADGSILVGGLSDLKSGAGVGDGDYKQCTLAKFTPAGAPDSNFGDGGRVTLSIIPQDGYGEFGDVAAAQGGGIFVAGTYGANVNGTPPYFFSFGLLKSDGTPNTGFNLGGYRSIGANAFLSNATTASVTRIVPLAGGKLLGVAALGNAGQYCGGVIRLKSDGTTDATFAAPNGLACYTSDAPQPLFFPLDVLVLPDGKILLAGVATHGNDSSNGDMAVLRLLDDGTVDDTFGDHGWAFVAFDQGGSLSDAAAAVAVDSQGRIILAGDVLTATSYDIGVARLLASGEPDPDFGSAGRVIVAFNAGGSNEDTASSITVLSGDRLLIGAYIAADVDVPTLSPVATLHDFFRVAVRLRADGSLDPFFGNNGRWLQAEPNSGYLDVIEGRTFRLPFSGDYYFIPGSALKNDGSGPDFGVARVIVPLFAATFEEAPNQ